MGKASRRKDKRPSVKPAPFVARPFEGLDHETDLVAMRELIPAATAVLTLKEPVGELSKVTLATILPMAWPGLRRADGEAVIGLQSGHSSGDASRDAAAVLLALAETEPGRPVVGAAPANAETPRLQDLVDTSAPVEFTLYEGFDFWVGDTELDDEGAASLQQANESMIPTVALDGVDSAYWCRMGERTYIRWLLPQDEGDATDALARLVAAHDATLGDDTRLLGAFRASGLLVPVWEVPADAAAATFAEPMRALAERFAKALEGGALSPEERRAKAGLTSRQVTIR